MVRQFEKGKKISLSAHFSTSSFECHCKRQTCVYTFVDDALPEALESLLSLAGPFQIDSGFRCKAHNKEVGGLGDSQHLLGKAADCKPLTNITSAELASYAGKVPAFLNGGIGTYSSFCHLDVRNGKARWGAISNKVGDYGFTAC